MVGFVAILTITRLLANATVSTAAQEEKLAEAIRASDSLDDTRARTLFDDVLATSPPDRIAARAYLYLSLLDFNALDRVHAREEMRRALELDAFLEGPPGASPKFVLELEEMRRRLVRKLKAADQTAPLAAVSPPVALEKKAPRARAWPWVFGAAALVAAGASAWGWIEVASFEQLKSSSSPTHPVPESQAENAQSLAQIGEPVGIVAAVAAAGLLTGTVLTW